MRLWFLELVKVLGARVPSNDYTCILVITGFNFTKLALMARLIKLMHLTGFEVESEPYDLDAE